MRVIKLTKQELFIIRKPLRNWHLKYLEIKDRNESDHIKFNPNLWNVRPTTLSMSQRMNREWQWINVRFYEVFKDILCPVDSERARIRNIYYNPDWYNPDWIWKK